MKIRAHESFSIRKGWLHKGVKNIEINPRLFNDKSVNPCEQLGIGANMVKALRYWMNAVGIMKEVPEGNLRVQRLTLLGEIINEQDRYYEEDGTLWLLQYKLATNQDLATAWYWFFNDFKLNSFTKQDFVEELSEYLKTEFEYSGSSKVLEDEFSCLIRTYYTKDKEIDPEDTKACPFAELKLIEAEDGEYHKCVPDKNAIHPLVAFAVILDANKSDEILISDLIDKRFNIGKVFNLDKSTLFYLLESLQKRGYLTISRTAGLDVIRITKRMSFADAARRYYTEINGVTNDEQN